MARVLLSLLGAWFLACTGSALNCEYDSAVDERQGLDFLSAVGQVTMEPLEGVSDLDKCRERCCNSTECDLVLMGYPMDGSPQCTLVRCRLGGHDACQLKPSTQFKVYRKAGSGGREDREQVEGKKPRLVPLVGSSETKEGNESNHIRCRQPAMVGPCRAAFPRFFYNSTALICQQFTYGGCGGNDNSFETSEDCEATCSGVTGPVLPDGSTTAPLPVKAARRLPVLNRDMSEKVIGQAEEGGAASEVGATQKREVSAKEFAERCGAEPVVGPCRASFKRWYYNSKTGSCQSFVYGGCKGNANNYDSESSCLTACTVAVLPSAKKIAAAVSAVDYQEKCMEKADPGPCRAAFRSFYYNPDAGSCQEFFYGGCRGNKNRYESWEECMDNCDGLRVDTRSENRWTAGIFLFVTLAAISVLLLVALVFMLRRRNVLRRASSISDKEELLPGQPSVESLSSPGSPTKAD